MIAKSLYWSGRLMVNGYARSMFQMDVLFRAALPDGPKIIALNHPTTIDPFLTTVLLKEQAHILISESLFKVPMFGAYLRRSGHIPVFTRNGGEAFREAQRLLHAGKTIVIFPEGALSPVSGGHQNPHTGTARLALSTGAPVIPVGIELARERIRFMHTTIDDQPETAQWYLRGPYAITVGVPLYFKGDVENHDYVLAVTDQIMGSIMHLAAHSKTRMQVRQSETIRRNTARRDLLSRQAQDIKYEIKTASVRCGSATKEAAMRATHRWLASLHQFRPNIQVNGFDPSFYRRYFRIVRRMTPV
ncbi:MAG: 1-acyl-sn-glycerol-3-phosphate acyltransferase [Anaerolineae bacterium]|nr:1-acyl-sn-glycerol-3-phosphate acyltransferase [Anaerolineae bacterium]